MDDNFQTLTERLGYVFQHIELLKQALRHRSVGSINNERLEFLGDAILGFVISVELYQHYPRAKEGELSRLRSSLVNREALVDLALELQLSEALILGVGERKSGGAQRHSILADAVEALIGAIYLDSGMDSVRACIMDWFGQKLHDLSPQSAAKDPKTALQEWLQAHKFPLPLYESFPSGKAHEQIFRVVCSVEGLPHRSEGISTSRRRAERIAAERFLELLHDK
ncbi:MAG: ribonuclease III [Coxiella sp. RIFCSPHIGHO2_12_FULL_42_15]|nr:MAG: ribonuclease III [Coxiella sp. RIFCSPHIGHO2_12_FULL_42_15]